MQAGGREVKFARRSQPLPSSREEKIAAASETGDEIRGKRNTEHDIRNTEKEYGIRQWNTQRGRRIGYGKLGGKQEVQGFPHDEGLKMIILI